MIRISKVTMDYVTELTGVSEIPQIGWVIKGDGRNERQQNYQLQIATDNEFLELCYDSGVVMSDQSAHIRPEMELTSLTKYFVHVSVTMEDGQTSGWSQPVYFVTSLCRNEWSADFISADSDMDARNSKGTYVRKQIVLKKPMKEAYIVSTALGLYELYINGERVGRDELTPGFTSYRKHLVYQTYEVTGLLRTGDNVIGAMIGAGWYKGKMGFLGKYNNYGSRSAFIQQLLIRYTDGSSQWIVTDETWKGNDAPILFAEIYDGETYDANQEITGWCQAGLDDSPWRTVEVIPYDMSVLEAQGTATVKEIEPVPARRIFNTPEGDLVIDFGQNLTGWIHVKAWGRAGDEIMLHCFEVLDAAGNVYLDNLRGAKQQLHYIFAEEKEVEYYPSFTFQGFQYAKISKYPGEAKPENFVAYAAHSEMGNTGMFECSNPLVNQLQHNILWGMKGNFVDVPTDCPQRNERLGWTGDAQIFCRTASYLMNTYHFYKKWLRDVEVDQTPEGGVPHVVPDLLTGQPETENDWLLSRGTHSAAAWADVAVIMPWVLYQVYGDQAILEKQYASMKNWVDFMRTHAEDYIWNYKLQFGDWVALDAEEGSYFGATPNDLTGTAYFAYTTGLFAKACKVLERTDDADFYLDLHHKIVAKYQRTFFAADGALTVQTQTAHIITLYFNLAPKSLIPNVVDGLKRQLKKENGHLVTGFVGTPYFCHALSENGCTKEAYDLLLKDDFPSWLYQVKMGATTIWEHWDGIKPDGSMWSADMNSFNHYAYGAVGEWLYRVCAGIEIDDEEPGYKHIIFQPQTGGGFRYAWGTFESIYGQIISHWSREDDIIRLEFEVPVNTTATIYTEPCREILESDGLSFRKCENGYSAETGSGRYVIKYRKNC